jgi:hypothetical protein
MSDWIRTVRGALTLNTAAFTGFRDGRDVFYRGLLLIVVVALLAGLPTLATETVKGLRGGSVAAEMDDAAAQFDQAMRQMEPFLQNIPADVRETILAQAKAGFQMGADIAVRIEKIPTFLPRRLTAVLEAFGRWLSRPFGGAGFPLAAATLGTWLGYGVWVVLVAKLLGGRGTLPRFFGTTGLFAVPHVLNILHPIPFLGGLVGFIAFLWGAAIYVKATAVSQELTVERALLAVVAPILAVILLLIVLASGLAGLIAIGLAGQ